METKNDEKYKSLLQNNIWLWIKLPSNRNLVGCKRVYNKNLIQMVKL
jgi:hypothetical protein